MSRFLGAGLLIASATIFAYGIHVFLVWWL